MIERLRELVERARSVHVLVVGDVMLDEYITGSATRISPEAPVPVVAVKVRRWVPGGAANVAANVAAMGATVSLAGVTGSDDSGTRLRRELDASGIGCQALVVDSFRGTTTKTRVTAGGQQIVRFDVEDTRSISGDVLSALQEACESAMGEASVVVISDYAKGTVGGTFCQWIIEAARSRDLPVVVDPKASDFSRYRGATVITPNLKEALAVAEAPGTILPSIAPSSLLVTRGEDGMSLFEPGSPEIHIAAAVNEVADVTGAGDTVVGVLAVALGSGFPLPEAAGLANFAAGVAVGHHGTWAVSATELLEAAARL